MRNWYILAQIISNTNLDKNKTTGIEKNRGEEIGEKKSVNTARKHLSWNQQKSKSHLELKTEMEAVCKTWSSLAVMAPERGVCVRSLMAHGPPVSGRKKKL